MRYYQLFEYNSTQTLTNYREPLESRLQTDSSGKDVLGTEPTPEAVLAHLEAIDPTKKKAFVINLINWYIDGSMRFIEDAYKAKDVFPLYTKFKNRNDVPHISKLSFNEFLELGDRLSETKSGAELNKEEELDFYNSGQAELLKDTDEVKIVIPKTKRSAIYFGRNTKWCTSAVNDNMFDRYKGPFYIFLFKKENKRWQFEFNSKQFMDEQDVQLSIEDIYKGFKLLDMSEKEMVDAYVKIIAVLESPSEELQMQAFQKNGRIIEYIKNPSEEIKKLAVQKDGHAIEFIENPSEEVQKLAVKQNGEAIQHIEEPSEEVQKLAVQENGEAIQHIEEPSEEIQRIAVQQYGYVIKYIENPSEEVQRLAVQENGYAIEFIENPSEEVQKLAVQEYSYAIEYIKNPSEEVQRLAVQKNGNALRLINNPSEEIQMLAVTQNWQVILYIRNPSEYVQKIVVEQKPFAIRYFNNPTETIQKIAVKQDGYAIMHIENQSEELQKLAVQQNSDAIRYIENPSEEVKRIAATNK